MKKPETLQLQLDAEQDDEKDKVAKKRKTDYFRKVIEILQDRCEETGKDLEAPPIVRKVLNIIFLVLGVALLLGVLIAVIVTVIMQDDGRSYHSVDVSTKDVISEKPTSMRSPIRKAMPISWPPRRIVPKPKAPPDDAEAYQPAI